MKYVFTIGVLLSLLAGCKGPERVINTLPPPLVPSVSERPAWQPPTPMQPPVAPPARSLRGAVVVVDPGHGGKDTGALPKFSGQNKEKTIVLDIAQEVGQLLSERGARVIMTRNSDVFIELDDRAAMADRYKADLFVSIHADSSPKPSISGVGVHIYTQASFDSQRAAQQMVAALNRAGNECRGIFRNNFHVLREHSRPAMLIECGYVSNSDESRLLNTAGYRAKLAAAIVDGVAGYFSR